MPRGPAIDAALIWVFAGALFYGDLYLGVTVPAVVLVLPFILAVRAAVSHDWRRHWRSPPAGLVLLAAMGGTVAVQAALGYGPRGRSDLVIYLPLAYAGLTIAVLSGARIDDRALRRSLAAGGVLAGGILAGTLLVATPGRYALPGQSLAVAQQKEDEMRARLRAESVADTGRGQGPDTDQRAGKPAPLQTTPEPEVTGAVKVYYRWKNLARTPLGMSNYLAVLFVFLFNVMLYQRSRWAAVFAVCVLLSVSRSGLAFLVLSGAVWYAHRRGRLAWLMWVAAGSMVAGAALAIVFWPQLTSLPGAESIGTRAWYISNALGPIGQHPLFGAPRSEIMRLFGYPITWTPHTSLLHLWVFFGIVGTAAYAGYMAAAMRTFARRAGDSALWRGVTAAVAISLVWSTIELVVLTPAFEILVAALYAMARHRASSPAPAAA